MEMMDCVEVIVEKEKYAREGVHKGMQGWICDNERIQGYWLVNFPGYGAADDIAEEPILEEDLKVIPAMDAEVTERIKAEYDAAKSAEKKANSKNEDISVYLT